MGVFRSLGALGRALGPAFGSLLFWSLGPGKSGTFQKGSAEVMVS